MIIHRPIMPINPILNTTRSNVKQKESRSLCQVPPICDENLISRILNYWLEKRDCKKVSSLIVLIGVRESFHLLNRFLALLLLFFEILLVIFWCLVWVQHKFLAILHLNILLFQLLHLLVSTRIVV